MAVKVSVLVGSRERPIFAAKLLLSRLRGAFIGDQMKCRSVDVVTTEHVIVCRESFRAKVLILLVSFLMGPGLGAYFAVQYFQNPRLIEMTPWFPRIAVPLCIVGCTLLLVRTIRWQRVIVLDFGKKLAVFAGRSFRKFVDTRDLLLVTGVRVHSIVRAKDMENSAVGRNAVTCYLLTLNFADGAVTLFETTDRTLTELTASEISSRLGVALDGEGPQTESPTG